MLFLGLVRVSEAHEVERLCVRGGNKIEKIGSFARHDREIGRGTRFERFHKQDVGPLVRGYLPCRTVANGDILDDLVIVEHDARLHRYAAIDPNHFCFVIHHFDEAGILRRNGRGDQGESERGNDRAGHACFSIERSRAFGVADLNLLPMPEPRARALLAIDC